MKCLLNIMKWKVLFSQGWLGHGFHRIDSGNQTLILSGPGSISSSKVKGWVSEWFITVTAKGAEYIKLGKV